MTNDEDLLNDMKKINAEIGVAKMNESMAAKATGSIEFQECKLKEVVYVPDLSTNLLSVNAMTKNGGEVLFTTKGVTVKHGNKTIMKGEKLQSGLFQVKLKPQKINTTYLTEKRESDTTMWHRKLGHINYDNLKKLATMSDGIDIPTDELKKPQTICGVCQEARQTRNKMTEVRTRASRPLQIIHTDLCGPISPNTWDGKRYFLTFLDDYTHYVMVYLIKNKSEVPELIREYILRAEAHWNLKLSKLRCDNGREYINEKVTSWCRERGTQIDNTIPHTPQLNGKAERLNRTLMEKARALMFDSELSKEMWGEALYTSAYLLNRIPTETIQTTPYEMWEKRKPNLESLRIFGSQAYAKVLGPLKKLDKRSEKHVFVGYAPTGYRLWNSDKRKITVAKDVKFAAPTVKGNDRIHLRLERTNEEEEETENTQNNQDERENWQDVKEEETTSEEDDEEIQSPRHLGESTPIRRSNRDRKQPDRYGDQAMLTYLEAVTGPDKNKWTEAINEEKRSLKENKTWEVVEVDDAQSKKPLRTRWVFKVKKDGIHKARLVVRGCEQKHGINYEETYSPVISASALRSLFAIAAAKKYSIVTFDVKTAFLYGTLEEEIYVWPPQGYKAANKLFKLNKALYGLKQAPLRWNIRFTNFLKQKNFEPLESEQCLFKRLDSEITLGIYVDDGILIGSDPTELEQIIKQLSEEFKMTAVRDPKYFVGFEIIKGDGEIKLMQSDYIEGILEQHRMEKAKPAKVPIQKAEVGKTQPKTVNFPYREIVGSLLYASSKTRPDISYAVNYASRHVEKYSQENINEVKHILKYLNGNIKQGLKYSSTESGNVLTAYCDADFVGDTETRRSTTGYVIFYADGAITWCSRKQSIIALSSTEAEYIAAAECCKELLYLKTLFEELLNEPITIKLNVDNQSAIALITNGVVNKRSKHIDVKYRFVHDLVKRKIIKVNFCPTDLQVADIFTKPLNVVKFDNFKRHLVK